MMLSFINLLKGATLLTSCFLYVAFSFCLCALTGMSAIVCHSSSRRFRNRGEVADVKGKQLKGNSFRYMELIALLVSVHIC